MPKVTRTCILHLNLINQLFFWRICRGILYFYMIAHIRHLHFKKLITDLTMCQFLLVEQLIRTLDESSFRQLQLHYILTHKILVHSNRNFVVFTNYPLNHLQNISSVMRINLYSWFHQRKHNCNTWCCHLLSWRNWSFLVTIFQLLSINC